MSLTKNALIDGLNQPREYARFGIASVNDKRVAYHADNEQTIIDWAVGELPDNISGPLETSLGTENPHTGWRQWVTRDSTGQPVLVISIYTIDENRYA